MEMKNNPPFHIIILVFIIIRVIMTIKIFGGHMVWDKKMPQSVIDWLLEEDENNPSIRYFTLIDLLGEEP